MGVGGAPFLRKKNVPRKKTSSVVCPYGKVARIGSAVLGHRLFPLSNRFLWPGS